MQSLSPFLHCIGLTGQRRVVADFFGLGKVPRGEKLSLRQHMERMRSPAIMHLNIIRVGFHTLAPTERERAERELDLVVHRTRQIYDQIFTTVGRVQHFELAASQVGGFADIGSDGEADDLTDSFSVDNNGIDSFFVLTYVGTRVGSARVSGCDKDGKNSGVVVEIGQGDDELTATAYAHELAHFLGVEGHSDDENNLMFSGQNGRQINSSQAAKIITHCFITECPDLQ
ncbi:MAG: hypothetical protein ACT4P6_22265 [Gemmatimonadaceae bacterium]